MYWYVIPSNWWNSLTMSWCGAIIQCWFKFNSYSRHIIMICGAHSKCEYVANIVFHWSWAWSRKARIHFLFPARKREMNLYTLIVLNIILDLYSALHVSNYKALNKYLVWLCKGLETIIPFTSVLVLLTRIKSRIQTYQELQEDLQNVIFNTWNLNESWG